MRTQLRTSSLLHQPHTANCIRFGARGAQIIPCLVQNVSVFKKKLQTFMWVLGSVKEGIEMKKGGRERVGGK